MFDKYYPEQKVNINNVSGILSKTCEKSYFQCCHRNSKKFEEIVDNKSVVVLQAMLMSDGYVMFEVITYRAFEQLKENK